MAFHAGGEYFMRAGDEKLYHSTNSGLTAFMAFRFGVVKYYVNCLQKGHVLRALFTCSKSSGHTRSWASSLLFGGRYIVNQK